MTEKWGLEKWTKQLKKQKTIKLNNTVLNLIFGPVLMFSTSLMDDLAEPLSSSELLCDFLSLLLSLLFEGLRVTEGCLSVFLTLDVGGSTRSPDVDLCGFLTSFLLSTAVTTALEPWGVFPDTKSMFSCTSDFA